MANEQERVQTLNGGSYDSLNCSYEVDFSGPLWKDQVVQLEEHNIESDILVGLSAGVQFGRSTLKSRVVWDCSTNIGTS